MRNEAKKELRIIKIPNNDGFKLKLSKKSTPLFY